MPWEANHSRDSAFGNSNMSSPVSDHKNIIMKAFKVDNLDIDVNMFDKMRRYLQISPSLPDGHCFLYSIVKACHTQLYPKLNVDVDLILDRMNSELTTCPNIYTAFMEGNDIGEMHFTIMLFIRSTIHTLAMPSPYYVPMRWVSTSLC